jgi:hypothetical protein
MLCKSSFNDNSLTGAKFMEWVENLRGKVVGVDTALFFVTNDVRLPSLPDLPLLVLDDLVKRP